MKASINIVTGLLIESSSDSHDGTLVANAVAQGILASDVEIRIVTEDELAILITARDVSTPEGAAIAAKIAQTKADIAEARLYVKLTNLSEMTPTQVRTWVAANVTNLAQAQDAIATLAIAVGILWRDKQ